MSDPNSFEGYLAALRAAMAVPDAGRIRQEQAARLPIGVSPTRIPSLTPSVGEVQAADALVNPNPNSLFLEQYLADYLFQTPIRDSAAYGYQAAVRAPGTLPQAIGAGFGAAGQYLWENIPDYLRIFDEEGRRRDPEDRPTQPGFGEIFAESRIPLPEGVSREEFLQDVQDMGLGMSGGENQQESGGRPGISPDAFAQKYGISPELHPASMMEEAGMMYGINDAFQGGVADLGFEAMDAFDIALGALGLAGNVGAVARVFTDDDYLAIAAPGIWRRKPTATRAGTPQAAMDVYDDIVRRYETLGPSGDVSQMATDLEDFFGGLGARIHIDRVSRPGPYHGFPTDGAIQMGETTLTFDFRYGPDGSSIDIGTLRSERGGGKVPHQFAAVLPILDIADLHGLQMATFAAPFGHANMNVRKLEDMYNKLGFRRADASSNRPGSSLIRDAVSMETDEARAAAYAAVRDPVIQARAAFDSHTPKNQRELQLLFEAWPRLGFVGNLDPGQLVHMEPDNADDYVRMIFRAMDDLMETQPGHKEFPGVMERTRETLIEFFRRNAPDPELLRQLESSVEARTTRSIDDGQIYSGMSGSVHSAPGASSSFAPRRIAPGDQIPGDYRIGQSMIPGSSSINSATVPSFSETTTGAVGNLSAQEWESLGFTDTVVFDMMREVESFNDQFYLYNTISYATYRERIRGVGSRMVNHASAVNTGAIADSKSKRPIKNALRAVGAHLSGDEIAIEDQVHRFLAGNNLAGRIEDSVPDSFSLPANYAITTTNPETPTMRQAFPVVGSMDDDEFERLMTSTPALEAAFIQLSRLLDDFYYYGGTSVGDFTARADQISSDIMDEALDFADSNPMGIFLMDFSAQLRDPTIHRGAILGYARRAGVPITPSGAATPPVGPGALDGQPSMVNMVQDAAPLSPDEFERLGGSSGPPEYFFDNNPGVHYARESERTMGRTYIYINEPPNPSPTTQTALEDAATLFSPQAGIDLIFPRRNPAESVDGVENARALVSSLTESVRSFGLGDLSQTELESELRSLVGLAEDALRNYPYVARHSDDYDEAIAFFESFAAFASMDLDTIVRYR